MNHRYIITFITFLITAIIVGGVVYFESPRQLSSTSGSLDTATDSSLKSIPTPTIGPPPAESAELSLGQAQVWVGLQNSDAVGLRLDLKAEVFLNQTKVGEGQLNNVASGSSGFNNAKLNTIPLTLIGPAKVPVNAALKITLAVRRTCFGGGHNSGTARLWYNDSQANSNFGATIVGTTSDYFLRDGFTLSTTSGPGPKKTIDVGAGSKSACPNRPCTPFGTWIITVDPTAGWPTYTNTQAGYTVKYPPDWVIRSGGNTTVFSNVIVPAGLSDNTLQTESFFEIGLLAGKNPNELPIEQWFDQFFSRGFSATPEARTSLIIDGHNAVRIELSEIGRRVHIYIAKQTDVIEIVYGLFAPHFLSEYESTLNSLKFTQ